MSKLNQKITAMLYGIAYGDAIGAPVEKLSAQQIHDEYGYVNDLSTPWHRTRGGKNSDFQGRIRSNGIVTDDTLMTIALINIYNRLKRPLDAWDMANEMVKEIAWKKVWVPELQKETAIIERLFYPEKWIFQRHQLASCDPREGGIGNMINCGAAMYIAPVGAVNACNGKAAYDEAINFAQGHQASYGLEAAGVFAACVAEAFSPSADVATIINTALSYAKDGTRMAITAILECAKAVKHKQDDKLFVAKELQKALIPYSPMQDDIHRSIERNLDEVSASYTPSRLFSIEELPIALAYIYIHDGDFSASVLDGINSGRDTDSIGVMIGAILGALHGEKVIDHASLELINKQGHFNLKQISDDFTNTVRDMIEEQIQQANIRESLCKKII